MPPFGVSVTSTLTFRGNPHRTSRVYHYQITSPDEDAYTNLALAAVAQDKLGNSNQHAYKEVRVWGPTDGPKEDNLMRVVDDISGNGAWTPAGPQIYPELAYYVTMYIGRSPTSNRKVFLKKFIHPGYWKTNTGVTAAGMELVPSADLTFFKNWFEGCVIIDSGGDNFTLCSPRGQLATVLDVANTGTRLHIRQLTQ